MIIDELDWLAGCGGESPPAAYLLDASSVVHDLHDCSPPGITSPLGELDQSVGYQSCGLGDHPEVGRQEHLLFGSCNQIRHVTADVRNAGDDEKRADAMASN